MKKTGLLFALLVFVFLFSFCKKNSLGGDATIVVFPQHHGRSIKNLVTYPDTIFIKFDATELPGTTPDKFDTYFVGEAGEDHVHCKGLRAGKYYLYGVGMDSTGPYRVKGGMEVKISWFSRKKEIDTNLPVTE